MSTGLGRLLSAVAQRLARLSLGIEREGDPWERIYVPTPLHAFGDGAQHEFGWYLTGTSTVHVASGADVRDWLLACEYVSDAAHHAAPDVWQHPCEFERVRRGDCEDHALWAWRKFLELGLDADFVVGRHVPPVLEGRHAWVMVRMGGTDYLVETTARTAEGMIRPLALVRDGYRPECGVGRDVKPYVFGGYLHSALSARYGEGASAAIRDRVPVANTFRDAPRV